jgi:endonuclease YncB( thermonuclease family)
MLDRTIGTYAKRMTASAAVGLTLGALLLGIGGTDARTWPSARPSEDTLSGRATVVDGDTIDVAGVRVRLEGIDAPEAGQPCRDDRLRPWDCGGAAARGLGRLIAERPVTCTRHGIDKYGRVLGICRAGDTVLNAEMVRQGLAWAFVKYSQSYVAEERQARAERLGVWQAANVPAWEHRRGSWEASAEAAPEGCPIKGNVTRNGRIYHMPWSPWYAKVRMDPKQGKRWFCSEDEAIKAGWRPAGGPD